MKKLIIALLIILAVIGTAIAIFGAVIFSNPERTASAILTRAAYDLSRREEIEPLIDILYKGSAEFSVDVSTDDGNDIEAEGKIYFGKDKIYAENVRANILGYNIRGELYISDKLAYVCEDGILGGAYALEAGTACSALEASALSPDSGSEYALDEDTYAMLSRIARELDGEEDESLENIVSDLTDMIKRHAVFSSERRELELYGKSRKVRVTDITLSGEAAASLLLELYSYLLSNGEVAQFIDNNEMILHALLDTEENGLVGKDLKTELYTHLESMERQIRTLASNLKRSDQEILRLELITTPYTLELYSVRVYVNGSAMYEIDLGSDCLADTECITLSKSGNKTVYTCKEINGTVTASIYDDLDEVYTYILTLDQKSGRYTLESAGGMSCGGTLKKRLNKTVLTVDSYSDPAGTEVSVSITARNLEFMPRPAKDYATLDALTEDELKRIYARCAEAKSEE